MSSYEKHIFNHGGHVGGHFDKAELHVFYCVHNSVRKYLNLFGTVLGQCFGHVGHIGNHFEDSVDETLHPNTKIWCVPNLVIDVVEV